MRCHGEIYFFFSFIIAIVLLHWMILFDIGIAYREGNIKPTYTTPTHTVTMLKAYRENAIQPIHGSA